MTFPIEIAEPRPFLAGIVLGILALIAVAPFAFLGVMRFLAWRDRRRDERRWAAICQGPYRGYSMGQSRLDPKRDLSR